LRSEADVTIRPEILFVPNAFTPNADGTNEFWEIKGNTCSDVTLLQVFNKWGQLIFETNRPLEEFWDGTFQGSYAPQGVYVWRLRDGEQSHVGTVTLIY
jgi:gliding motility-associated-like protein